MAKSTPPRNHARPQQSDPQRFQAIKAADVKLRRIEWLWDPFVPLGKLSLVAGRAGIGKGTFLAFLAAQLSRGELDGALTDRPASTLFICGEDGFEDTIAPRCLAAGADLDRVFHLRPRLPHGDPFELADSDLAELRQLVDQHGIALVILDPLVDVIPDAVDEWRQREMRQMFRPLSVLADEEQIAVAAVMHFSKRQEGTFSDRISGSHASNDFARSALLIAHDPADEDEKSPWRTLTTQKANLTAAPSALRFKLASSVVMSHDGLAIQVPVVRDLKPAKDVSNDAVVHASSNGTTTLTKATALLRELLADNRWHEQRDVQRIVAKASSEATAKRAIKGLEVESRNVDGAFPRRVEIRLPAVGSDASQPTADPTVERTADLALQSQRNGKVSLLALASLRRAGNEPTAPNRSSPRRRT